MSPEIVTFVNASGPLTKRIALDASGVLRNDSSACKMVRGFAERTPISCIGQLATVIGNMQPGQAIALGSLRVGLPGKVEITTKRALNGSTRPDLISRTANNIVFPSGTHGFALLDYDTKGMPDDVADRLNKADGFWGALESVMPGLDSTGRIMRASTSAGLYREDNGAAVPGSSGIHIYLAVGNVADSGRFLRTLHDRCWIAGFGWMMVGAGGQLLERSVVDRMVGAPERLVFEGSPVLIKPLAQSSAARRPDVVAGGWLDTETECPPLTVRERAQLTELRSKAAHRLAGDSARAREEFIERHADDLAKRSGISRNAAKEVVIKQCKGLLLPSVVLPFDDEELAGKTVGDVLADPGAFEGETLADPLEGAEYGQCKARIMRRADGAPWIHSFAHGRTVYELKLDAVAIRAAMAKAEPGDMIVTFIGLALQADIDAVEEESLIDYAADHTGSGKRVIGRLLQKAKTAHTAEERKQERERHLAERDDPRPMLPMPALDAPWLPQMAAINDVLDAAQKCIPPTRNISNAAAEIRRIEIATLHAFSKRESKP